MAAPAAAAPAAAVPAAVAVVPATAGILAAETPLMSCVAFVAFAAALTRGVVHYSAARVRSWLAFALVADLLMRQVAPAAFFATVSQLAG